MLQWLNATLWWYGLQWQDSEGAMPLCKMIRWLIPPMVWCFMIDSIIPKDVLKLLIGSNLGFGSIGILLGPKLCQYAIVVCKTCSIVCYFTDACLLFHFIWVSWAKRHYWLVAGIDGQACQSMVPIAITNHASLNSIIVYDRIIMISLHEAIN